MPRWLSFSLEPHPSLPVPFGFCRRSLDRRRLYVPESWRPRHELRETPHTAPDDRRPWQSSCAVAPRLPSEPDGPSTSRMISLRGISAGSRRSWYPPLAPRTLSTIRAFFNSSRINSRNFSGKSLSAAISRILIAPCSCRRASVIIACSAYSPFCEIFNSSSSASRPDCAPFQALCLPQLCTQIIGTSGATQVTPIKYLLWKNG